VTPELVLDRRGPSLVVRLNRPEARNALTPDLLDGIGSAVAEAEADPAIRALILTGTGDRAFCAGMDLRSFASGARFPGSRSSPDKTGADAYRRLIRGEVGVPVIGAANGTARAWERLGELQTVVFGSEDAKEGAMAFIEKRQPQWTGA